MGSRRHLLADEVSIRVTTEPYLVEPRGAILFLTFERVSIMNLTKSIATASLSVALLLGLNVPSAFAAATITGTVPVGVASGATADVPVSLSGVQWEDVLVTMEVNSGGLGVELLGDTAESAGYDLTDTTATVQSFYGTFESVNDVLGSGLTWYAPSTPGTHDMHFTITVQEYTTGLTFNPDNGHYYLVPHEANGDITEMSGSEAFAAAEGGEFVYAGMTGYLVEIGDADENEFVAEYSGGQDVWIGASSESAILNSYSGTSFADNVASRGKWYWVHSDTQFAEGLGNSIAAINSAYLSFASGEPNDSLNNERCLVTNWDGDRGEWNDLDCGVRWSNSMVIEFDDEAAAASVLTLTDLDIEAAPAASSKLAATGFDLSTPLALAFAALAVGFIAMQRTRKTR